MADPINHDGVSTVATVGSKVAKWGLLGAVAGFVLAPAIAIGGGYAAVMMLASGTAPGILGGIAVAALTVAGTIGTWGAAGAAAVGGAALGVLKGADQVSKETSAFRTKVTERMNNRENKEAKTFNDGEIKGLDEGYALATNDLKPQLEAAREQGRQEGAQMVVEQIQQHMQQEMAAQQQAEHGNAKHRVDAGHEKTHAPKQPVQIGNKVIASCECPDGSKAAAIAEQRQAEAGHTLA